MPTDRSYYIQHHLWQLTYQCEAQADLATDCCPTEVFVAARQLANFDLLEAEYHAEVRS